VRFSGPEENTMRRAMSRDHVSYGAWSMSDTSGHVLDAWSRQIRIKVTLQRVSLLSV